MERSAVKTLTYLLTTISIYLLLWQGVLPHFDLPDYYYGRLMELMGLGLFIALALHTPMRFEEMGIVADKKTLFHSLALGGGIALIAVAICAAVGLARHTDPLFSWHVTGDISRITYFIVAPAQEILAKSVMYYSFELAFGREHPMLIIFMCTLTFGIFHVAYGIGMMLLAMALTVITCIMFRRVRCVWGCALAHFALGFFPVCFGL